MTGDAGRADPWVIAACCEIVVVVAALVLDSQFLARLGLGLVAVTIILAAVGTVRNWSNRT